MKILKTCLLVLATSCCVTSAVRAQDLQFVTEAPCAPEVVENRRAVIEHNGEAGIWFHLEVARCMAFRLSLLPEYEAQLRLLDDRLTLSTERDELQERQLEIAVEEAETARDVLETAVRDARRARKERDAWFRHPALWVGAGVTITIILEITAVMVLAQVQR